VVADLILGQVKIFQVKISFLVEVVANLSLPLYFLPNLNISKTNKQTCTVAHQRGT